MFDKTEDVDFRTSFVREPSVLKHYPALVLNADFRPLSYYPLSLWPWQEAIKAAYLDRVTILAQYDEVVRSQHTAIRIPSVVVLKDYVKPQKRVAFTRFNLFLRDEFCCQYCGSRGDLTFDHVCQRFQRTFVNTTDHPATTTIIEQRIDRFLQHPLFVANDDFRGTKLNQTL